MLTGRHIVCISSIDWDFVWQGHQEIMSRFADAGNVVLFVENTGVRAPRLTDVPRLRHRLRNWRRGVKGFREERPNLFVYSPLVLPLPYSRVARALNVTLLSRSLRRWMRAVGAGRPIVWTYLPTPAARVLIHELDPELTVYYCADDFAASSGAARRVAESERRLFAEADLVFVTSERLRERAARTSNAVHLFPGGVKYEAFEAAREAGAPTPDELRDLPRPVIGYVGGVHQWVDEALLVAVARALPSMTFVLVGPLQTDTRALAAMPNVRLLGARPHADIPRYIAAFDVGLVPYRRTEYTANVYPTKLNEYLAMGKPVVSTDLSEVRRFNTEHGDIVAVASEPGAFAEAIREALHKTEPAARARRIDVAKTNSWTVKIARMSTLMESVLARRRAAPRRWQDVLQRSYRRARRRIAVAVVLAVGSYALLFESPFVWWVAEPLTMAERPARADAIVVFAGGTGESGKAGGGYQERVKRAVELYQHGYAPRIVFSSGYVFAFPEATVMRELATNLGVPDAAITLETKAASTYENVLFTSRIVAAQGGRSVLLVSSPYHMRRAVGTWRTQAPAIAVTPVPVAQSQFYVHTRGATLEQIDGIAHEYGALLMYRLHGWVR